MDCSEENGNGYDKGVWYRAWVEVMRVFIWVLANFPFDDSVARERLTPGHVRDSSFGNSFDDLFL
jgi:hypothetical protein